MTKKCSKPTSSSFLHNASLTALSESMWVGIHVNACSNNTNPCISPLAWSIKTIIITPPPPTKNGPYVLILAYTSIHRSYHAHDTIHALPSYTTLISNPRLYSTTSARCHRAKLPDAKDRQRQCHIHCGCGGRPRHQAQNGLECWALPCWESQACSCWGHPCCYT